MFFMKLFSGSWPMTFCLNQTDSFLGSNFCLGFCHSAEISGWRWSVCSLNRWTVQMREPVKEMTFWVDRFGVQHCCILVNLTVFIDGIFFTWDFIDVSFIARGVVCSIVVLVKFTLPGRCIFSHLDQFWLQMCPLTLLASSLCLSFPWRK